MIINHTHIGPIIVSNRKNKLTSAAGINLGAIVTNTKGIATHRIHTNVLRTRPRTQNVAYHATGDDVPPLEIERQDGPGTLDSPYYYSKDGEWEEVYPHSPMTLGKYQTMIEKSKKEQNDEERRQYHVRQQIESLQKEIEAEIILTDHLKEVQI